MIRRLGQILALITVLAATLNAQCAAACALVEPSGPANMADHSCCKHHKSSETPCVSTNAHATDATLDIYRASVPAPMTAVAAEWIGVSAPTALPPEPVASADTARRLRPLTSAILRV